MPENIRARRSILGLVIGALSFVGCGPSDATQQGAAPNPNSAASVSIVRPQRKALKCVVEQPGVVQAYEETRLFARVPGYVRLFYDDQGRIIHDIGRKVRGPKYDPKGKDVVEPGEVLAEILVPELEQEVNLKKATVRQAEADVKQAEKAVASAEATIATMEAAEVEAKALLERWASESIRIAGLVKSGTIDEQSGVETNHQFKAAGARVQSAAAAVRKAKADRDKMQADVRSAEARVDVAKADSLRSETMLGYAKIRAPYDGIVTGRNVKMGDLAQPAVGQGDWLFKVARIDPVRVVIPVPEADAELVNERSEVKLTIQSLSGMSLSGFVTRTSWSLESGARTLRTEIDLPNKDGKLRPETYVYAQITSQAPESWTLPTSALTKQGDAMVCFLIEGDKAVRTPVQVGRGDGQFIVVRKRQKPGSPAVWEEFNGDEKVAARAAGLADGQTVQPDGSAK